MRAYTNLRAHTYTASIECEALIYVYQMPDKFVNPLQLKNAVDVSIYAAEQRLHRLLLDHPCRTKFAPKADFFYVPVLACQVNLPTNHPHIKHCISSCVYVSECVRSPSTRTFTYKHTHSLTSWPTKRSGQRRVQIYKMHV